MNANRLLNDVKINCSKSIINFGEDKNSYFERLFDYPKKDRLKQAEFANQICDYNSVFSYVERLREISDKLGIVNVSRGCESVIKNIQNEQYSEVSKELEKLRKTYDNVCVAILKAKKLSENC